MFSLLWIHELGQQSLLELLLENRLSVFLGFYDQVATPIGSGITGNGPITNLKKAN